MALARFDRRGDLIAKGEEELSELVALCEAEAGKQLVLGVALSLRGALQLAFPGAWEGDDVPAAALASVAPLSRITAMMSIDALELSEGETVLIVGATGGVGSRAVQLAARAGATVVAPALPEDEAYLHELGVSERLPRGADLAEAARERRPDGFDAALNLISFEPESSAGLLNDGGRLASRRSRRRPWPNNVMAAPTTENLQRLAGLLNDGTVRVPFQTTYELAQAPEALTALSATHT